MEISYVIYHRKHNKLLCKSGWWEVPMIRLMGWWDNVQLFESRAKAKEHMEILNKAIGTGMEFMKVRRTDDKEFDFTISPRHWDFWGEQYRNSL